MARVCVASALVYLNSLFGGFNLGFSRGFFMRGLHGVYASKISS